MGLVEFFWDYFRGFDRRPSTVLRKRVFKDRLE